MAIITKNNMLLKDMAAQLLDKDVDVLRWHNNLGSDSAKRTYLEGLAKFEQFSGLTPKDLVKLFQNDKKKGEDMLTDYFVSIREKYAPGVKHNILVGIKSWLRHNDIVITRKINTGNRFETPTITNERPPTQKEMGWIIGYANPRAKAAISLIAFAGLRPTTASSIVVGDIPNLVFDGEPHFNKIPARIMVRPEISKNKRPYMTFLSSEGCKYLQHYLKTRFESGEKLILSSPVIKESSKARIKTFSRKGFQRLIKRVFNEAGFKHRPYVLRSYFATAVDNSRVPHNWAEFWLGHTGDVSMTYTVRKRLPDATLDDMMTQFKENVEPFLSSTGGEVSRVDLQKSQEEIKKLEEERLHEKAKRENLEELVINLMKKMDKLEDKIQQS